MTKKLLLLTIYVILSVVKLNAQVTSTETFETESNNSTSFTDNGQNFTVSSVAPSIFSIQGNVYNLGWNGTTFDSKYIDNEGTAPNNSTISFSISSSGSTPFKLNSMWLFLSDSSGNVNVTGSLTIIGKLAGVTQYTATASSGFNTNLNTTNGYTQISLSSFGGQNNANKTIDQIEINTGGNFFYVALDAFRWTTVPGVTATQSQTNVSCNGTCNGSATVTASGGVAPYTYSWSPSGGTGSTASSLCAGTYICTITDSASNSITKTFTITQPTVINTATGSQTNVSCNGGSNGSASVSPSGGAGSYTYSWSPSGGTSANASGLSAGTYTVTVTDANSCTATRNFTITQPTAISTATGSQTNVSCNGGSNGSATVSPSGGAGSYTYSWSPSGGTGATASGLSAGTYTVTVTDANSCTATRSFTITQPTAISTATGSQTNVPCNGGSSGSASVSPSGGAGSYTYSWSPSGGTSATASGLSAGTYTVTVTDANSCIATRSFTITQPTALSATASSQTNVSCNGGSNGAATVSVSGGTPGYTYSWSPTGGTGATASGLTAGTYTVTVTDANSCTATRSFTITQPSAISAPTATSSITYCQGVTATSLSATPLSGNSLKWYSVATGGTGSTTAIVPTTTNAGTTNYYVAQVDSNNCESPRTLITVLINPISTVNPVSNQQVCNNQATSLVSFTSSNTDVTYSWTNTNPSIGLAANGIGVIPSFIATNMNANPITGTITVTPKIASINSNKTIVNFDFTGSEQIFTVPENVTSVEIDAYGASGANGASIGGPDGGLGAKGAQAKGTLAVIPGQIIKIYVGGQANGITGGYNGGGNGGFNYGGDGGGGGGATDIRINGSNVSNRVLVAGGGGGGAGGGWAFVINQDNINISGAKGGNGGTGNGSNGGILNGIYLNGFGAIGSSGGAFGLGCSFLNGSNGQSSTNEIGGSGGFGTVGNSAINKSNPGGGGGGGGFIGGGGGGASTPGTTSCTGNLVGGAGGGAGGTSFVGGVTNSSILNGIKSGNGKVIVSYNNVDICYGEQTTFSYTIYPTPTAPIALAQTFCANNNPTVASLVATGTGILSCYNAAIGGTALTTGTPLTTGTYYVSQTINGCESARTLVSVTVNTFPLISGTNTIEVGANTILSATTTPANSNVWTSSNMNVATINPNGVVTGLTPGSTTITYTNASGCTATQTITVTVGSTQTPVLNSPVSNTTGATSLNINYSLPENPLSGSVRLTFTPTAGGTPIVWTMTNATSVSFSYAVGTNPVVANPNNVLVGTALSFTNYNLTLSYQDAFGNPVAQVTNTNIQTLAPPNISFASSIQTTVVNRPVSITTINAGGGATFTITPALPVGVALNSTTGLISGTPTTAMASRQYTVTATNAAGTSTATFNLFIDADLDGDGIGDATDPDIDGDGVPNSVEIQEGTSPTNPNDYKDTDGDGVPDYVEIRQGTNPNIPNILVVDTDGDGILDSIDTDDDGDTILDINDAFPLDKNEWKDSDRDGRGDNADTDDDNDGILDVCDVDVNGDRIPDNGTDMDGDGIIDSCDTDRDGDGVNNTSDNCPDTPNRDQADRDRDGKGDVCVTTELNVSEGLTPNGDGINDTWVVYNLENHPGSIVRVFNANGKEVFYSNNYQNDWAGNYQGSSEMLPVGSYLYQIDLGSNGSIDVQGWLYITK